MDDGYIFLVEDNADDEELTRMALRKSRVANDVIVARDGAEALDILFSAVSRPLPALTLLDLQLPKVVL